MLLLRLALRRADVRRAERGFRWAQLASSAAVSLGHGGNDAQKTMGVIAALLVSTGHLSSTGDKLPIPLWVVLAAHAAIAAGTVSGGWRIVRTMGVKITKWRPVSGFAAETGAAIALFGSTALGAPVSTTHTVAGSVSGVGLTNRATSTNWRIFGRMALAWLVTMPFAGVVAAVCYHLATLSNRPLSVVVMTALLLGLVTLLALALKRAPKAADIDAETREDEEVEIPLRPGTGSVIGSGAVPASAEVRDADRSRADQSL